MSAEQPSFGIETNEQEQRDQRLAKRHIIAVVAYAIERRIAEMEAGGAVHSLDDLQSAARACMEEEPGVFPDALQKSFLDYVEAYWREQDKSKAVMDYLRSSMDSRLFEGSDAAEKLGRSMFLQKTKGEKQPQGTITCEQRGSFFIIICANKEDFFVFDTGDAGEEMPEEGKKSSGFYYANFSIGEDIIFPNAIIMRGDVREEELNRMIEHEQQHLLNRRLFTMTNQIENEVYAYFRDGRYAQIKEYLFGGLYNSLLPSDTAKRENIAQHLDDIVNACIEYDNLLRDPEIRGVLVYALFDAPFEKFPEYIRRYGEWYSHLGKEWNERAEKTTIKEEFDTDTPDFGGGGLVYEADMLSGVREFRERVENLRTKQTMIRQGSSARKDRLKRLQFSVRKNFFPDHLSPEEHQYIEFDRIIAKAEEGVEEARNGLYRDGTHIPCAEQLTRIVLTDPESFAGKGDLHPHRKEVLDITTRNLTENFPSWVVLAFGKLTNHREQEAAIRDSIFSACSKIPRDTIDRVYTAIQQKDDAGIRTEQEEIQTWIQNDVNAAIPYPWELVINIFAYMDPPHPRFIISYTPLPEYPSLRQEVVVHVFPKQV